MKQQQSSINEEVLLLCERTDIAQFLYVYIKHLFKKGVAMNNVQIINFNGLEKLPALLKRLEQLEGCERVRKALIVADSGDSIRSKSQLIGSAIRHSFLAQLEYCQHYFFLVSAAHVAGTMAIWRTCFWRFCSRNHPRNAATTIYTICTADFLLSINGCRGRDCQLKNESRHMLCGYLSGTDKYAGMRIAEAAQLGAFDLDNKRFDSLKNYLLML